MKGFAVRKAKGGPQILPTEILDLFGASRGSEDRTLGQAQQDARVGGEAQPNVLLAGKGHPRKGAFFVQQVGDQLEVEMRRPISVLRKVAEPGDLLTACQVTPDLQVVQGLCAQMPVQSVEGRPVVW